MTITAKVEGVSAVEASLQARVQNVLVLLQKKIFSLELRLQTKIQGNLASGIGLKSRHGTAGLAGSVRAIPPVIEGQLVTGSVEGAGGTSWYGGMWEGSPAKFAPGGHKEIVPVNKKVLSFLVGGKRVFAMHVSAQGPRPWFRPPFEEFKPTIIDELKEVARGE